MSTFVLVHGGMHGGWCWYKVASRLRQQGHIVLTPDLPGHGIDRAPIAEQSLKAYADHICEILDQQTGSVVLLGHSLGGLVVTQAAEWRPQKVRKLVYLTALLSAADGSLPDMALHNSESILFSNVTLAPDQRSFVIADHALRESFYEDCSDEDVTLARMLLVPESTTTLATLVQTMSARYGSIPRVFIHCLRDKALTLPFQKQMVQVSPCEQVMTLDTSHSPFFSAADELVACLAQL